MQKKEVVKVKIKDLGVRGEGIGVHERMTYFVPGALPGEIVLAKPKEYKKKYVKAELHSFVVKSPSRQDPPCPVFHRCGGCQIMHLNYAGQLAMKRKRVQDNLERIGKIHDVIASPCIASEKNLQYRNKIQLPATKNKDEMPMLGLYAFHTHEIIEVKHCRIHCAAGEKILRCIPDLLKEFEITPYEEKVNEGYLRYILIRTAMSSGGILLAFITSEPLHLKLQDFASKLSRIFPEIKGILHYHNSRRDNVIVSGKETVLKGSGFLQEKFCGLLFQVSMRSFFQVNPDIAQKMLAEAIASAGITENDMVLDAYCGVGIFTLLAAKKAKKSFGIEANQTAVSDAEKNAVLNHITNAEFTCTLAEEGMRHMDHIDILFLNPPRKGCHEDVITETLRLKPRKILYMSCNSASLARDLAKLRKYYVIEYVQPYDMFPQTMHVETLASLSFRT
ncbi:MAG: 23S rRNA (uracil(1939)-C(5))-methyltransferase RlmD [Simkaniaceae bacterium]